MGKRNYITAEHAERGTLYAGVDPAVHHIAGRVAESRFAARLSPFKSEAEARAALVAEGVQESALG
jgi:hypothetical protein